MEGKSGKVHYKVSAYYSEITNKKGLELASSVCSCSKGGSMPKTIKKIVSELPDEIVERYYGCGSPVPNAIEGCTILDLGCGTGRDVYAASKLTGAAGKVIGVDMNDDQLAIAEKYREKMAAKWGYANVEFRKGYIEDLKSIGIEDGSIDVVISNCVINLSPDKESVFSEIRRVLRDGGVLFFSDIFSDRKVPEEISTHPLLLGECMGGSMSCDEFKTLMDRNGFADYRIISSKPVPVKSKAVKDLVGDIRYTSDTVRAVKNPTDNACCSDLSFALPFEDQSACCC